MSYPDILNNADTFFADWFSKDPGVEANSYHAKLVSDLRSYLESQLPAVAVNCYKINCDDDGIQDIEGFAEIVVAGEPEYATGLCKKISVQVFESLKKKMVPGKSMQAVYQKCVPTTVVVNPIPLKEGFRQVGTVAFRLQMFE